MTDIVDRLRHVYGEDFVQLSRDAADEIERLRESRKVQAEINATLEADNRGLHKRIEELEESREILCQEIDYCCDNHWGNHFVTAKQIGAAWAVANNPGVANAVREGAKMALRALGIVWCGKVKNG